MRLWKALDDTILKLPFSLRVHLPAPAPLLRRSMAIRLRPMHDMGTPSPLVGCVCPSCCGENRHGKNRWLCVPLLLTLWRKSARKIRPKQSLCYSACYWYTVSSLVEGPAVTSQNVVAKKTRSSYISWHVSVGASADGTWRKTSLALSRSSML